MAAAETELGDLNQRVVDLTSNLNNILGSLTKLETWISTVDAGIQGLNKVVEEILARGPTMSRSTKVMHPKPLRLRSDPWSRRLVFFNKIKMRKMSLVQNCVAEKAAPAEHAGAVEPVRHLAGAGHRDEPDEPFVQPFLDAVVDGLLQPGGDVARQRGAYDGVAFPDPINGESPMRPVILFVSPPVDMAAAVWPFESTTAQPTVSGAGYGNQTACTN
uniref:Transposon protein, putative, unclassified n=1 Tax=Oryza sativa subsp. japonica TaxID=39947 RepID=Q2QMA8_ORYSJ|nr:transposon protein, putative, unclassified [Oryza sativa Japonica Group]